MAEGTPPANKEVVEAKAIPTVEIASGNDDDTASFPALLRQMRRSARLLVLGMQRVRMPRLRRSCRPLQADAGGPFQSLRLCRLGCLGPRHLK